MQQQNSKALIDQFGKKHVLDTVSLNYLFLVESESLGAFPTSRTASLKPIRTSLCQNTPGTQCLLPLLLA